MNRIWLFLVKDHVLLSRATELEKADELFRAVLTEERIREIVALVPDDWLKTDTSFETVEQHRDVYIQFLTTRLAQSNIFVKEAQHAGKSLI